MTTLKRLAWLAQNLIACTIAGGLIWLAARAIDSERYGAAVFLAAMVLVVGLVQKFEYRRPPEL